MVQVRRADGMMEVEVCEVVEVGARKEPGGNEATGGGAMKMRP